MFEDPLYGSPVSSKSVVKSSRQSYSTASASLGLLRIICTWLSFSSKTKMTFSSFLTSSRNLLTVQCGKALAMSLVILTLQIHIRGKFISIHHSSFLILQPMCSRAFSMTYCRLGCMAALVSLAYILDCTASYPVLPVQTGLCNIDKAFSTLSFVSS